VFGKEGAISSAAGKHEFAARAGHHLAPQPRSSGRSVFEALGDGFVLVALDAPVGAVADFARAAKRSRVPLKIVEDTRSGGRERYDAALILVRPDQFVAWAADVYSGDADMILARAAGR
jgi:hypothetical protein